jgi:hypothetical protein
MYLFCENLCNLWKNIGCFHLRKSGGIRGRFFFFGLRL